MYFPCLPFPLFPFGFSTTGHLPWLSVLPQYHTCFTLLPIITCVCAVPCRTYSTVLAISIVFVPSSIIAFSCFTSHFHTTVRSPFPCFLRTFHSFFRFRLPPKFNPILVPCFSSFLHYPGLAVPLSCRNFYIPHLSVYLCRDFNISTLEFFVCSCFTLPGGDPGHTPQVGGGVEG